MNEIRVHATAIAIGRRGVLLRGAPGSGKSDLALRLIDDGARLVADDLVEIARTARSLDLRPTPGAPARLRGKMEVRGIGIVAVPSVARAPLALVVDLVGPEAVERLPAPGRAEFLGRGVPRIALAPFEASAPAKVRLAVARRNRENTRR